MLNDTRITLINGRLKSVLKFPLANGLRLRSWASEDHKLTDSEGVKAVILFMKH